MVYDGMSIGFDELVLVPNIELPSVNTLLCSTSPTSWMVGLDIEGFFLTLCWT